MEGIGRALAKRPIDVIVEDRRTQHGELLKEFCERLNEGRASKKLPPITMSRMGKLLKTMGCRDVQDIYVLIQKCRGAKGFGGLFWFLYNSQKKQKQ